MRKKPSRTPEEPLYPMRVNRRVAMLGLATRAEADELIKDGLVVVNNKQATIGQKVLETDEVLIAGRKTLKNPVYYAYNKPTGIVTMGAAFGERAIKDVIETDVPVFPVGRLDKDSQGLIILTNDGRVTDRLLNPDFVHEKEYVVTVDKEIQHGALVALRTGVRISPKEKTRPAKVRRIEKDTFEIILTEGKNRQIRKMCAGLGYKVLKLTRFRVMNILLGNLKPNTMRKITGKELEEFLSSLGLGAK